MSYDARLFLTYLVKYENHHPMLGPVMGAAATLDMLIIWISFLVKFILLNNLLIPFIKIFTILD